MEPRIKNIKILNANTRLDPLNLVTHLDDDADNLVKARSDYKPGLRL